MRFMYSRHWKLKQEYRLAISEDLLEYAIIHSSVLKDRRWEDALNAICRIPANGRLLKVVYKRNGNIYKIITAYWLD